MKVKIQTQAAQTPTAPELARLLLRRYVGPRCAVRRGSKLKGLWGRCPQPPSPCGFAHVGDRYPVLGHLPQAPMLMRFQAPGACCSWLRLDRILVDAPGSCFAGAPGLSTEAQ